MTKELQDFFKIISEGKKSSKKETENESLLSNEKVSVSVKASELKDFFSAINEEKRKLKEQQENDKKKLLQLEQLLFAKDKEKTESEKSQEDLEPIEQTWEDTESYEIEQLEKEKEPNLEEIREKVQEANNFLLIEPSLVDQAAGEISNPNIIKVEEKPEVKEINPEEVIKELSKISKNTGVKLNEDINDLEGLKKEFFKFSKLFF